MRFSIRILSSQRQSLTPLDCSRLLFSSSIIHILSFTTHNLSEIMTAFADDDVLVYILRVCVCMTFAGHGYLATQTQSGWYAYLAVAGIGKRVGGPLMRLIGVVDLALAALVLFAYPSPLAHCWCMIWGFSTAMMRPLAGESVHQFIERSGNFLPSLALMWMETRDAKSEYTFEQLMWISAALIAGEVIVCVILRVTGLLKDKPTAVAKKA